MTQSLISHSTSTTSLPLITPQSSCCERAWRCIVDAACGIWETIVNWICCCYRRDESEGSQTVLALPAGTNQFFAADPERAPQRQAQTAVVKNYLREHVALDWGDRLDTAADQIVSQMYRILQILQRNNMTNVPLGYRVMSQQHPPAFYFVVPEAPGVLELLRRVTNDNWQVCTRDNQRFVAFNFAEYGHQSASTTSSEPQVTQVNSQEAAPPPNLPEATVLFDSSPAGREAVQRLLTLYTRSDTQEQMDARVNDVVQDMAWVHQTLVNGGATIPVACHICRSAMNGATTLYIVVPDDDNARRVLQAAQPNRPNNNRRGGWDSCVKVDGAFPGLLFPMSQGSCLASMFATFQPARAAPHPPSPFQPR